MFAKLYDTKELGQILVKIDDADEGPEVRFFFEPEGLGVCSMAMQFTDADKDNAWDKADKYFEQVTEEIASVLVQRIIDDLPA